MSNLNRPNDIKSALKTIENFYLEFLNNYLTHERMAEDFELWHNNETQEEDLQLIKKILDLGRYQNDKK